MVLIAVGFAAVLAASACTPPYWCILLALIPLTSGMAMSMSPMTAAIMSAVPARRAGAGSAMNDATRELGAALGVAVLGSIAASQYSSHLHDALERASGRGHARPQSSSIAGALHAAEQLPGPAGRLFELAARTAFVDGIHVAALFGVGLAIIAAVLTTRYLPRHLTDGALHSPVDAIEDVAELGLGGAPPLFDDHESPNIDEPVGATSSARAHRVGSQTLP